MSNERLLSVDEDDRAAAVRNIREALAALKADNMYPLAQLNLKWALNSLSVLRHQKAGVA